MDVTFLRLDADLTSAVLIVNLTADGERSFTYLVHPGLIPTFRRRTCRRSGSTNGFTSAQLASPTGPLARRAFGSETHARSRWLRVIRRQLTQQNVGNTDEIPELIARSAALASICKVSADELCQLSGASHWQDARYYLRDLGCDTTIISLGPMARC